MNLIFSVLFHVETVDTRSKKYNTFNGMHVNTVDTASTEHIALIGTHVDTVDTTIPGKMLTLNLNYMHLNWKYCL